MELEPITRKEKIIAGENLEPITRLEKFLKEYGGSGVSGGGGSPDAVLYTPQTLTDAQKKQARDNIDAVIADFVVNGTVNSNMEVTLDKTFAQIQAAIQEGKQPLVKISGSGFTLLLSLASANDTSIAFYTASLNDDYFIVLTYLSITSTGDVSVVTKETPSLSDSGSMHQINMTVNPSSEMQIATKKYVDDKECILKSTTPGSTKKFKMTVDDSGNISATEVT